MRGFGAQRVGGAEGRCGESAPIISKDESASHLTLIELVNEFFPS